MVQNVEQILSRGERIELLVDKTDTMASQATAFRRGARSVRRQMWWRNSKIIGLSVFVALVSRLLSLSPGSENAGQAPTLFSTDLIDELTLCLCHCTPLFHSQVMLWIILAQFCGAGLNHCKKS
jgi:hypothetical protein